MKKLIAGVLLLALSYAPSIARAEMTGAPPAAVGGLSSGPATERAPVKITRAEAGDYAAREAANPALAAFEGGDAGIYIGGSALTVVLIVLLIVIIF